MPHSATDTSSRLDRAAESKGRATHMVSPAKPQRIVFIAAGDTRSDWVRSTSPLKAQINAQIRAAHSAEEIAIKPYLLFEKDGKMARIGS